MLNTKGRILIIEKNDITRKLIAGILSSKGYEAVEAVDGAQAFQFFNRDVSLVLLDIDHHAEDGMGFLRKLSVIGRNVPVVLMSEDIKSSAVLAASALTGHNALAKPVVSDRLLSKIETSLVANVEENAVEPLKTIPPELARHHMEDRRAFMKRAIDLSQQKMHENCGGPFGAIIVRAGKIIGEGWNQVTSTNDPTAHAEMVAIRAACQVVKDYSLAGCEIYTSCEPCPMCLAAIYWARIDRIFYANTREDAARIGFDDDFIYREIPLPFDQRTMPLAPLMRDEAQIVFDEWLHKVDKTPY